MTNQSQLPTPDQACASLDAVDQDRRATATLSAHLPCRWVDNYQARRLAAHDYDRATPL